VLSTGSTGTMTRSTPMSQVIVIAVFILIVLANYAIFTGD